MSPVVEFVMDRARREPQRADERWEAAVVRLGTAIANDTQRIADHGKIHGYARGLGHMSIAETSGTIVLNCWGALRTATADEIREHLDELDENLAILSRWSQLPRRR